MSAPGHTSHLLLVEDSEDDAFFFQRIARRVGMPVRVTHVLNGLAAVEVLKAASTGAAFGERSLPALVFLDLKMPEMNGFELLQWIQHQPALSRLKVIVLSGSEDAADIVKAKALGALECVTKPIREAQLQALLERHVVNASPSDGCGPAEDLPKSA